ncbi:MAG: 6-phosphogluconolactonase [Spirochaetaceae bacterium]|nr:MAG: 6-phosphogluconolactonase [Spirochaetaceae bacterium]
MSIAEITSRGEAERRAAEEIAASLTAAIAERGRASLALPGGRSIAGVLTHLRSLPVRWEVVTVIPADERVLPLDDPDRNWTVIERELTGPLRNRGAMSTARAIAFPYKPDGTDWGLAGFEREIDLPRNTEGVLAIDVIALGAGEDGHVASLFPGSDLLASEHAGYLRVDDSPKPPPRRITVSPRMIRASGLAVVLFLGESKAEALRAFTSGETGVFECPARLALEARRCEVCAGF